MQDLAGHEESVRWVSFSADGVLASAGQEAGVRVWEGRMRKFLFSPEGDAASEGVAWSPGGKTLAGGSRRGVVYLWDAQGRLRGSLLTTREGPDIAISAEGHFQGSAGVERFWVVAALTEGGEFLALTPEEFAARYGWKNDPSKVQFSGRPAVPPK
jgi:WD40 repeat protein